MVMRSWRSAATGRLTSSASTMEINDVIRVCTCIFLVLDTLEDTIYVSVRFLRSEKNVTGPAIISMARANRISNGFTKLFAIYASVCASVAK